MKVIDLLNKIANGKAPKKIIFDKIEYELCEGDMLYYNEDNVILEEYCNITQELDSEVKIIEEPKKIKKSNYQYSMIPYWKDEKKLIDIINNNFEKHQRIINEIIDYINKENK